MPSRPEQSVIRSVARRPLRINESKAGSPPKSESRKPPRPAAAPWQDAALQPAFVSTGITSRSKMTVECSRLELELGDSAVIPVWEKQVDVANRAKAIEIRLIPDRIGPMHL